MTSAAPEAVTRLLERARAGDRSAVSQLMPLVYGELHRVAARSLRREHGRQTLQTTALVHEAYLRLFKSRPMSFQDRAHFLAIAARSMRQILIERARARGASKRGGGRGPITLDESLLTDQPRPIDFLDLHNALNRLAALDDRQARIVECRFFGGLTVEETAEALDTSPATVKRDWTTARAWLFRELTERK
jgi:RNA polymerase sigma factor (TIGR02999 family)